ncbi:MAG: pyridoxal-phosphate dependent enzyme [Candidatus Cloacimonetes bacterium]|jgi:threonine synthase|nr:pyridoxal-phosphate dependent enzyme [Candidatus Cloacimonadota bacterium]MCB5286619.1 pyridoxal-phosphate dependent enzyme [Candidatus Cloacimonadota bacterium]MCK9185011.1 pyridoxal-phosphate dependent enzyme [Candidatus Cloacimonadota bacterium]MCK9583560.1 pyridoxal-phosphate dependent enzyme [Candidatus Cloacimonadota bacterium]MDY0228939.1 pyridoxal-phosphate dependent enzyme [Candidatus Cloacimonadaceae bacterium]
MNYFNNYRCTRCGQEYEPDRVKYLCPVCSKDYQPGMPLPGILECVFDYARIAIAWQEFCIAFPSANPSQKIEELCELFSPLNKEYYPNLPVGNTPLICSQSLVGESLYLKFDGVNPSGSYKDRASNLVVAEAKRLGIKEIVTASTGNAAASLAALCAAAGIKAVIFAPAKAPPAKLVQIKIHKAELHLVEGTYDDAFAAALAYSATHECLNRNTAYHPFTIEGKKTGGLELYAQLGVVPDYIFVPTGDGVILCGIAKAFYDLKEAGIADRLPILVAAQSESSDAITSYWETGVYKDAAKPQTVADSISVKTPSAAHLALKVLKDTKGMGIRVSDEEILSAQKMLASRTGIFCEPSSAATLAAYFQAREHALIKDQAIVVLMLTGHGLKDINAVKFDD